MKKLKILIVYPNIPLMLVTPLAVATFVWIVRRQGHEVELFDTTKYIDEDLSSPENRVKYLQARKTNLDSLDAYSVDDVSKMRGDFRAKLASFRPDLLLYSFTEDSLNRALDLLRISNELGCATVVGGILATSDPKYLLSFPEVSIVAEGEGELVVETILRRMANGEGLKDVPSLWLKSDDGTIVRNPPPPFVSLDDYSTDFSLFDDERFVRPMGGQVIRAIPIETYRGCPNKCTYCNSPLHNTKARAERRVYLRRRSVDGIRKEMRHLVDDYDINFFYIVDDDFLARPKREIEGFIEMYREFGLPFWMNTRAEHVSLDVLQGLKEIGLFRVSFGIESGNEVFRRDYLGRKASNEKLLRQFEIIRQSGIDYSVNVIIGFPYETREMVFDTIEFCRRIEGYDALTVSVFTPYRGTVLRDQAIAEGWLDPNAMTVHTTASSMLDMPSFSAHEIDGMMRAFPLYVEFDEEEWPEIEKIERFAAGSEELFERYSERYRERKWGSE